MIFFFKLINWTNVLAISIKDFYRIRTKNEQRKWTKRNICNKILYKIKVSIQLFPIKFDTNIIWAMWEVLLVNVVDFCYAELSTKIKFTGITLSNSLIPSHLHHCFYQERERNKDRGWQSQSSDASWCWQYIFYAKIMKILIWNIFVASFILTHTFFCFLSNHFCSKYQMLQKDKEIHLKNAWLKYHFFWNLFLK